VQGYLSTDPERTVRVRLQDNIGFLTIKGKSEGITRTEIEYEIPLEEAKILLEMCLSHPIKKKRYIEQLDSSIWEIDVFEGLNEGLVLAEIELIHEKQGFKKPDWIQKEVSEDHRYYNSWLSKFPFTNW